MAQAGSPDAQEAELKILENFLQNPTNLEILEELSPNSYYKPFIHGLLLLRNGDINNPKLQEYIDTVHRHNSKLSKQLMARRQVLLYDNGDRYGLEDLKKWLPSVMKYSRPEAPFQKTEAGTYPSVLDHQSLFTIELTDRDQLHRLSSEGIRKIDPLAVNDEIFRVLFERYYEIISRHPNFLERLIDWKAKQSHKVHLYYERFPIEQLNRLKQDDPSNVEIDAVLLYKNFITKLESLDKLNKADVYILLKDLQGTLQNYPEVFKPVKAVIQNQLVSLLMDLGNNDPQEFLEYLKLLDNSEFGYCVERRRTLEKFNKIEQLRQAFAVYEVKAHNVVINHFLTEFLGNQQDLEPYDQFLSSDFLKQVQAKAIMLNTGSVEHIQNSRFQGQLESWINEISLEPAIWNPQTFDKDSQVQFEYVIKNVQEVTVRIFEVNTLSYYKSKQEEIKTDINLDGLVPQFEQTHQISSNPALRIVKKFAFPELEGKVGTFIIDFYGHGRHSRSIVRKGSLKYVSKLTAAGQLIAILDENQQIVKKEGAGVILQGSFYKVKDSGFAQLPFARNQGNKPLIITDGEISNIFNDFTHYIENYQLKASILAHQESFIYGHKAKIAVKPQLLINDAPAPLKLLQDATITVTLNSLKSSSTKKFEDIQFNPSGEYYTLYVEVPNQLTSVMVSLDCNVQPISTKELQPLNAQQNFQINQKLQQGDKTIDELYLHIHETNSYIELRGRNGELVPFVTINLNITHIDFNQENDQVLSTDRDGRVHLGDISQFTGILARASDRQQSWNLTNYRQKYQYPSNLNLCQGDQFQLPFTPSDDIQFIQIDNSSQIIQSVMQYVTFDNEQQLMTITDLPAGKYLLEIQGLGILVNVYDGEHWGNNEFIMTNRLIVQTKRQYRSFKIRRVERREEGVNVQLTGDYAGAQVHAVLYNFAHNEAAELYFRMQGLRILTPRRVQELQTPVNFYLPSRMLDEEYQYIINRKAQSGMIGNSLPKPQLLLKRHFVQNTQTDIQTAHQGEQMVSKSMAYRMEKELDARSFQKSGMRYKQSALLQHDNFPGFISTPAVILTNIPVNESGQALISVRNLNSYENVLILVDNGEVCAQQFYQIQDRQLSTRDLRLTKALDSSKHFTIQRKTHNLYAGETLDIEDINSTIFNIIDTLPSAFSILEQACGLNLNEWRFLSQWPRLSFAKKLHHFDKFVSHELNIFLYFKDPEFFNDVVLPFLRNKIERSFVDKWLLGETLEEYVSIAVQEQLNVFEKVLLVMRIRNTHKQEAEGIVKALQLESNLYSNNRENIDMLNNRKDIIIDLAEQAQQFEQFAIEEVEFDDYMGDMQFEAKDSAPRAMKKKMKVMGGCTESIAYEAEESESDEEYEDFEEDEASNSSSEEVIQLRQQAPQYYEKMESTKEYAETYYYNSHDKFRAPYSLQSNNFWYHAARSAWNLGNQVLTDAFIDARNTFEGVLFLAFLDLPYEAVEQSRQADGAAMQIEARSNFIAFTKVTEEVESAPIPEILLGYKFYDLSDQYYYDDFGNRMIKSIHQFIPHKIYGLIVTVTNTSESQLYASLLMQLPTGSIGLDPPDSTKIENIQLSGYSTQVHQMQFYFPEVGDFQLYPPNVSIQGKVIASARSCSITVRDSFPVDSLESFRDIAASGNNQLVIDYLRKHGINSPKFDIQQCFWMLNDPEFYVLITDLYREYHKFEPKIWAYGIKHDNKQAIDELIQNSERLRSETGPYFTSRVLQTDEQNYKHFEYDPLVNARAHRLGSQAKITNQRLKVVYKEFIHHLLYIPELRPTDIMEWVQYLIYQDRLPEAKDLYLRLPFTPSAGAPSQNPQQLQYDLISCYLNYDLARNIAPLYHDYPVLEWRKKFEKIQQLFEDVKQEKKESYKEPSLVMKVEENQVKLSYFNVERVVVKFYVLDLEVLFSQSPFFDQQKRDMQWVKPTAQLTVPCPEEEGRLSIPFPSEIIGKTLSIDADYGPRSLQTTYFESSLEIHIEEMRGLLRVLDKELQFIAGAYVKVYALLNNGKTDFYKDGYTDAVGKFDYVSLNTDRLGEVSKFGVFVSHPDHGALRVEAAKPPQ